MRKLIGLLLLAFSLVAILDLADSKGMGKNSRGKLTFIGFSQHRNLNIILIVTGMRGKKNGRGHNSRRNGFGGGGAMGGFGREGVARECLHTHTNYLIITAE